MVTAVAAGAASPCCASSSSSPSASSFSDLPEATSGPRLALVAERGLRDGSRVAAGCCRGARYLLVGKRGSKMGRRVGGSVR